MLRRRQWIRIVAVVAAGCWIGAAPALAADSGDLATVMPAETLVYLARSGDAHVKTAFEGSAMGRIMAEPEVVRLKRGLWGAVDKLAEQSLGGDGPGSDWYIALMGMLDVFAERPTGIALMDLGATEQGPFVHGALVCHMGDKRAALLESVQVLLRESHVLHDEKSTIPTDDCLELSIMSPVSVHVGTAGDYFILALGRPAFDAIRDRVKGSGETLAGSAVLKEPRKQIGGSDDTRSLSLFVNTRSLKEKLSKFLPMVMGPDGKEVQGVFDTLDALGFDSLASLTWEMHYRGKHCVNGMYLHTPEGGRGLLKLGSSEPLTESDLAVIPREPYWAYAVNFNLGNLYRTIIEKLAEFDEEAGAQVKSGIIGVEAMLGFKIDEGFLDLIGDTIIVFDAKEHGGFFITGVTFVLDSPKPKELAQRFNDLVNIVRGLSGEPDVGVQTLKHRGHEIQFLNIPGVPMPVAPAWAVHYKKVIVGLYPQMVTTTIDRLLDGDPTKDSILANEEYLAAKGVLGDVGSSFSYSDTRLGFETAYPWLLMLGQMGASMAQGEGVEIDIGLMPAQKTVAQHLFGSFQTTRSDEKGVLYVSAGSLPIGATPFLSGNSATTGMAVAVLLPALSAARAEGKRTVCSGNMRGLAQGCYIYANDHRDKFPDDIKELIDEHDATENQFICPSTTAVPGDALDSCYIYIPGQSTYDDPTNVIMYERPENHGGEGSNVLFLDGHATFLPNDRVEELVAKTKERIEARNKKE